MVCKLVVKSVFGSWIYYMIKASPSTLDSLRHELKIHYQRIRKIINASLNAETTYVVTLQEKKKCLGGLLFFGKKNIYVSIIHNPFHKMS